MERLWKNLIIILIITLCVVQILLLVPSFRATFCVVERLEGKPVYRLY
ncbi:MAG TPA: hypothetical protein GXX33_07875 [Firmicutes bacterium]|uniref:Uncharacterized protein n=1 Tax=Capillibacterium thermochitinicola TaxID=2699427 RepID=A0A8J6HYL4_9FIRM|nr:hypothetical protein [Capillibacterium thermochitinicola]MBA2132236.1 hypothetical protein [Capillibacterium thermochitinicola]HHW12902.1 hypothetical protein [Bacillota bacterium]